MTRRPRSLASLARIREKKTTSTIDATTALQLDGTLLLTVVAGTFPTTASGSTSPSKLLIKLTAGADVTEATFTKAGEKTTARLPEGAEATLEVTYDDGTAAKETGILIINVSAPDKDARTVKLDVGVAFSHLRNDKFELRDGSSSGSKQINSINNDRINALPVVFVHFLASKKLQRDLYRSILYPLSKVGMKELNSHVGFAIGGQPLGSTSNNYALGVSLFLGKQELVSVIFGMQFGQVDRLRRGYVTNSDYQNLKEVPLSKIMVRVPFVGFSYKF